MSLQIASLAFDSRRLHQCLKATPKGWPSARLRREISWRACVAGALQRRLQRRDRRRQESSPGPSPLRLSEPEAREARPRRGARDAGLWRAQEGFHLQHYNQLYALANCSLYQKRAKEAVQLMASTWPAFKASLMLRTQAIRVEALQGRTRTHLCYLHLIGHDSAVRRTLERAIEMLGNEGVAWATAFSSLARTGQLHGSAPHAEAPKATSELKLS